MFTCVCHVCAVTNVTKNRNYPGVKNRWGQPHPVNMMEDDYAECTYRFWLRISGPKGEREGCNAWRGQGRALSPHAAARAGARRAPRRARRRAGESCHATNQISMCIGFLCVSHIHLKQKRKGQVFMHPRGKGGCGGGVAPLAVPPPDFGLLESPCCCASPPLHLRCICTQNSMDRVA